MTSADTSGVLTVDAAVGIALKTNYGVLVAHDDAEIAKVNNAAGNAGMLPSAAVTASDDYIANGITVAQKTSGAPLQSSQGSINSLGAAALLSWTVFDGGKMFVTKSKLAELEGLGEVQLRDRVLQTVYDVTAAYYDIVRQKQQLESIMKVLTYNQERVTIMQTSFGQGLSRKTDLLQAQIDLNVDKENVLVQKTAITTASRTLNQLLSRDPDVAFDVVDSIPFGYVPNKEKLTSKLDSGNSAVMASQKQVNVADLTVKEAASQFFPRISVNGGYGVSQSNNPASSVYMSRTAGPQIGGSISIPLYQSGNAARQVQTAKLQLRSAEYSLAATKLDAATQLRKALDDFADQEKLRSMERDNAALAKENLDISMQRLRYGQSTALELRQAEESYEQSLTRLTDIEYDFKMAEMKIKELVGEL